MLWAMCCAMGLYAANKPLKIVYENDVHGNIQNYAAIAGLRDSLRKAGYPVITVSSGDFLQGTAYASMSKGRFCVDVVNALPYDVIAVGNHDLDYGGARLMELRDTLSHRTALLCCNLYDSLNRRCMDAYTVREAGGYKVAFVAVLTTATEDLEANVVFNAQGKQIYTFCKDSLAAVTQRAIDAARAQNPDYVILLAHMGEMPLDEHISIGQLMDQLTGVDVILDGHSHSQIESIYVQDKDDKDVLLSQTGSNLQKVGCLTLAKGEDATTMLIDSKQLPCNATVKAAFDRVDKQMKPILGRVMGKTDFELCYSMDGKRAVRNRETNLGDLVADAYSTTLDTHIGWVNGGAIRTAIGAGDITYGEMMNVSPFNNFMCVVEVTGKMLADALEECYRDCPLELGMFGQISNVRCKIDTTIHNTLQWTDDNQLITSGPRRVYDIEIHTDGGWRPLLPEDTLTMGSTYYIVYNGESRAFHNARLLKDKVMTDLESLTSYVVDYLHGNVSDTYRQPQGRIVMTDARPQPMPDKSKAKKGKRARTRVRKPKVLF